MAGRGPVPQERKRRRNVDTYADVSAAVVDDGQVRGPEPGDGWASDVVEWYEVWRRSPQAATFVGTDWQRLHMMAPLVEAYLGGELRQMPEIRQNESLLGATHADRLRNRIKVEVPEDAEQASVTVLYDANRLAGG